MKLHELAREHNLLCTSAAILGWDQETYMPEHAAAYRADQVALLSSRAHELATSPAWAAALDEADSAASSPTALAELHEMRRRFDLSTKLPASLVAEETHTSTLAKHAWQQARQHNDFPRFAPHLTALVEISRKKAELWGYPEEPYDALLSSCERGATTAGIGRLFDSLSDPIATIAKQAVTHSRHHRVPLPAGPYPISVQQTLNEEIAASIGFDFLAGRIDTTAHPFCTSLGPSDIRLTTRYDENDFTSSLFGILHEAGHGLYEQGLPSGHPGMPASDAVSLGIHESQSRLWENSIGRSRAFWEKWYARAQELFPQLRQHPLPDFLTHLHRAEYDLIRVESDEATYDLHILLRFDIERRLFRKELCVADLPQAWNDTFERYFGMTPPTDSSGCLQDIHWSLGSFGYFPTYTLGNLNAAQLMRAFTSTPAHRAALDNANYTPLLTWLRENIHRHGAIHDPASLIEQATGTSPDFQHHLDNLRSRYTPA